MRHEVAYVMPLYVPLEGLWRIALYIDDDIVHYRELDRPCQITINIKKFS